MCWNKYLHKKKKFKMTKKKKNEKFDEFSDKFDDKFNDNFTLNSNSTFNLTFKLFLNTKSSTSTLSFISIINQHSLSVWIIDTKTSNHLCLCEGSFLAISQLCSHWKQLMNLLKSLKSMISLCLVCSDSDI
jgi:hypothetical protein